MLSASAHAQGALPATAEELARIPVNAPVRTTLAGMATASMQPSAVDNSASPWWPGIGNQGKQASCVGWAWASACSYMQTRDEGRKVSLSPAWVYNLGNGGRDGGMSTAGAGLRIVDVGICSEASMPYRKADYLSWPSGDAWVEALRYRLAGIEQTPASDTAAIKARLAAGDVGVVTLPIYKAWQRHYPDCTGASNGVLYRNDGKYKGGHALVVVGYDDARSYTDGQGQTRTGALLLANSWGPKWGDENTAGQTGYLWVGYEYAVQHCGPVLWPVDRPRYRPRLYAVARVRLPERGQVRVIGSRCPPSGWTGPAVLHYAGGALAYTGEIAVDLSDGWLGEPCEAHVNLFVREGAAAAADLGPVRVVRSEEYAARSGPVAVAPGEASVARAMVGE